MFWLIFVVIFTYALGTIACLIHSPYILTEYNTYISGLIKSVSKHSCLMYSCAGSQALQIHTKNTHNI